jgi:hypothetical protein
MNPWHPITDPTTLKVLGKLAEELGECSAATARCIIQGLDEREPVTGKINREWLEDEISDVIAGVYLAVEKFGLNQKRIELRMLDKIERLKIWHEMVAEYDK